MQPSRAPDYRRLDSLPGPGTSSRDKTTRKSKLREHLDLARPDSPTPESLQNLSSHRSRSSSSSSAKSAAIVIHQPNPTQNDKPTAPIEPNIKNNPKSCLYSSPPASPPPGLAFQAAELSPFVRSSAAADRGALPSNPKPSDLSKHGNADLVTHDTAELTLRFHARQDGKRDASRRFGSVHMSQSRSQSTGTAEGITGSSSGVALPAGSGRPTFVRKPEKDLTPIERYFYEHNFVIAIDEEVKALQGYGLAALRMGLLYALNEDSALLEEFRDGLMDSGEATQDSFGLEYNLAWFDWGDEAKTRSDIIPFDEINARTLANRTADKRIAPTIALLGSIKRRIGAEMSKEARRKELRAWFHHPDRQHVRGEPLLLRNPKFKNEDMNYLALYARDERNKALAKYKSLWATCRSCNMIDNLVETAECLPPNELVKLEVCHDDFIDFNAFEEDIDILYYAWEPLEIRELDGTKIP